MLEVAPVARGAPDGSFPARRCSYSSPPTLKIDEGGWLPLLVGGLLLTVMLTWRKGSRILSEKAQGRVPVARVRALLEKRAPERVPGTAVFLTGRPGSIPTALLHNLKHNKVLHEQNAILSVVTVEDVPRVAQEQRATVEKANIRALPAGDTAVRFHGNTKRCEGAPGLPKEGLEFDVMRTSFFLSRRSLRPAAHSAMPRWQENLFILLARSASDVSQHFSIPMSRVVEVGSQVTI